MTVPVFLRIVSLSLLTVASPWLRAADVPPTPAAPMSVPADDLRHTRGEIRKIDAAQGRITLKHEDLRNLGMPGMTMSFKVLKPEWLNGLQAGDAVVFVAESRSGGLVVTEIRKASAP